MSMKRLAVIAAVSHFNGHTRNHNSTTMTTTTTMTMPATTITSFSSSSYSVFSGANPPYNQNNGTRTGTSTSGGNIANSPQIGGLGLLHQQNLRSGASSTIGGFTVGGIVGGAPVKGGSSSSGSNNINGNVNVLLGGAMLSVVTTVLCVVCYCCHRNIKKRTEAAYRQRWMDNDANMEIYSVEQCYETSGLFMESSEGLGVPALSHEPPPSYDAVVAMQEESQLTRISPPPDYRSMNDVSGSSNVNEIPKFIRGSNLLGMKKVLSAQSCCSLQRAEAENLFQLGVAAVAATSGRFGVSALGRKSLPYTARDSVAVNGDRVNNQPYYRGCPLCGKFRYDDSMSLSSDSGLDQVVVAVDVSNGNATSTVGVDKDACYCTPLQSPTIDDHNNNFDRIGSVPHVIDDRRSILTSHAVDTNYENAINNNATVVDNTPNVATAFASTSASVTSSVRASSPSLAPTTSANLSDAASADMIPDLDSINDNGIIRLDMSKIIDKTGLPTYEAALKLESSGYV